MTPSCDVRILLLCVSLHLAANESNLLVLVQFFYVRVVKLLVISTQSVLQTASLFPRTNFAIFVESAFPSSQTNISLYLLGCLIVGVWFVRLESWQTVFDPIDPLHGRLQATNSDVGEMEKERGQCERKM